MLEKIIEFVKEHHVIDEVIQKSPGMGLSIYKGKMKNE